MSERTPRAWEQPEGTLRGQPGKAAAQPPPESMSASKRKLDSKRNPASAAPSLLLTDSAGEGDLPECSEEMLFPLAKEGLRPWLLQSSAVSPTNASPEWDTASWPSFLAFLLAKEAEKQRNYQRDFIKLH